METMTCIKGRRSVRRYDSREIPTELFAQLLEAVRWAPSWGNSQCWELVVVKDLQNKQALVDCIGPGNGAAVGVSEAPVVVVFCGRKNRAGYKKGEVVTIHGDWMMFDVGLACEHFCLAAHDMGLGTVHVGNFDHQAVNRLLGLPEDVTSVEMIPVGYPGQEPKTPPRKEIDQFVHYEKY